MSSSLFSHPFLVAPKKIVVGMSGGVDSAVTAFLLKEMGFEVIGLFMKNWDEEIDGVCPAEKDYEDVVRVCKQIGVPYYSVSFAKEYKELVFSHFLQELQKGNTPNPDILCNREIKFKLLLDTAKKLGAEGLATGHYAINENGLFLKKALDASKDQTYFIYTLNQNILKQVLFPLGGIEKSHVRAIAKKLHLAVAEKKDSTGICFIGERHFGSFLQGYIQYRKGEFQLLDGTCLGEHQGVAYYTIGQRKGLGIGGRADGSGDAYFVVDKDVEKNIVYVEQGKEHPALFADTLSAKEASWVSGTAPDFPCKCSAKIRYRQADQSCVIEKSEDGKLFVRFDIPQRAITLQQAIVFYQGDICLGGATIENRGPSYYDLKKALPTIARS
jgi:tRNA-specific 2-thiouridylase